MCDQIRHRGPDDEGYRIEGRLGLGMRRLSILDLTTGRQPISNEDGTVWVIFNGEIYNYRDLRSSLVRGGHRFRTQSDTEVLVHLYEEEGVDGFQRLRGMFACALWDSRQRSLLLARDRFGKKPLYYAALPQGLYFGSELKCLRAAGVPLEHDREALQLYFLLGYIPDPWTPYLAIRKLPPAAGCAATPTCVSRKAAIGRYPPRPSSLPKASASWKPATTCATYSTTPSKYAWSPMFPWGLS